MESKLSTNREAAETEAAAWIARRESDGWNAADETRLRAWIDADFNHRAAWLRMDVAWRETTRLKALNTTAPAGAVPAPNEMHLPFFDSSHRNDRMSVAEQRPKRSRPVFHALAAGVALVLVAGTAAYFVAREPTYHTDVGALQAVSLSDGSKVTLNTSTQIRVAVTQKERRISLAQGEAYFEVAKDPSRPFIVDAGGKRIIAVGTEFSVRRDADDVRILVTEGAVKVESAGSQPALLKAGSVARTGGEGVLIQQKPLAEVEQTLSWRSGYLIFDQTPLADAVAEFNRYNKRRIVIEDPAVAGIPVGGNFRAANVDAFVRLIESELSVSAAHEGNRIVLKRSAAGK